MSAERNGLDLSDFEEAPAAPDPHAMRARLERRAIDEVTEFRRRDPADELTITIRGPSATIKAFKALCRAERRSQAEILRRMLEAYGDPKP
jgi:hypothetical protein